MLPIDIVSLRCINMQYMTKGMVLTNLMLFLVKEFSCDEVKRAMVLFVYHIPLFHITCEEVNML